MEEAGEKRRAADQCAALKANLGGDSRQKDIIATKKERSCKPQRMTIPAFPRLGDMID
jgi:hypothetical protein